jgi:hypothetical protein
MTEFEAEVDAHKSRSVNCVGGGSGSHQNFNVSIRGMVGEGSRSYTSHPSR